MWHQKRLSAFEKINITERKQGMLLIVHFCNLNHQFGLSTEKAISLHQISCCMSYICREASKDTGTENISGRFNTRRTSFKVGQEQ